jgi:hypothetical protein
MQIELVIWMTGVVPVATPSFLGATLFLGVLASKLLCPGRALKLNIKPSLMPQQRSSGFRFFFANLEFLSHVRRAYGVIT